MSLEQKTNEIFSKYLKRYNCSKHLMIMNSERVNLNYNFNDFDDVMVLKKIYYSKNLPKILISKKKLLNELQNLKVGKNDLLISHAVGSCGCTIPNYPRNIPVKPGESGEIEINFDSSNMPNLQSKLIKVFANVPSGSVFLRIQALVEPKNN